MSRRTASFVAIGAMATWPSVYAAFPPRRDADLPSLARCTRSSHRLDSVRTETDRPAYVNQSPARNWHRTRKLITKIMHPRPPRPPEPHQRSAGNRDTLAPSFSLLRMHLLPETESGNLEDYSSSIEAAHLPASRCYTSLPRTRPRSRFLPDSLPTPRSASRRTRVFAPLCAPRAPRARSSLDGGERGFGRNAPLVSESGEFPLGKGTLSRERSSDRRGVSGDATTRATIFQPRSVSDGRNLWFSSKQRLPRIISVARHAFTPFVEGEKKAVINRGAIREKSQLRR